MNGVDRFLDEYAEFVEQKNAECAHKANAAPAEPGIYNAYGHNHELLNGAAKREKTEKKFPHKQKKNEM